MIVFSFHIPAGMSVVCVCVCLWTYCYYVIIDMLQFVGTWVLMQDDCLAASSLQLLMKLKRHLKIVYSLNDARCQVMFQNGVSTISPCHK